MVLTAIIKIKLLFVHFRKRFFKKKILNLFDYEKELESNEIIEEKKSEKLIKKYEDKYNKTIVNNHLMLIEVFSIKSIIFEFHNYIDTYPCLNFRKNILLLFRYLHLNFIFIFLIIRLIHYFSLTIVTSSSFTRIIFCCISLDSLILIYNLPEEQTKTFEFVVANLYLLEMILKMISFGLFFDEKSYFRNKWNFLDFGVVVSIYFYRIINIFISLDLTALRNLIILRLIKLSAFQIILDKLFFAFMLLFDTFLIIMILVFICSLIGVQLFSGLLKYKCMDFRTGIFDTNTICGNNLCGYGYICAKSFVNPDSGVTNYDNIFYGLLQTLRLITLDNWTDLQALLQTTFSEQSWIYSIAIVALGNFFIINMMLAVLKVKYSECNPDTLNQIKVYLEKYKEKSYNLQELKAQGFYRKNKQTGRRFFGIRKKASFLSNGNKNTNVKQKKNMFSNFKLRSFNLSKIMNPQYLLNLTKKTFNLITKTGLDDFFHKTKMITMKEGAAELSNKHIEIRIDFKVPCESDSIDDVLPLK